MPDFSQTLHRVKLVLHGSCGEHQPAPCQDAAARILLQRTHPAAQGQQAASQVLYTRRHMHEVRMPPVRYCTHYYMCTKYECRQSGTVHTITCARS